MFLAAITAGLRWHSEFSAGRPRIPSWGLGIPTLGFPHHETELLGDCRDQWGSSGRDTRWGLVGGGPLGAGGCWGTIVISVLWAMGGGLKRRMTGNAQGHTPHLGFLRVKNRVGWGVQFWRVKLVGDCFDGF